MNSPIYSISGATMARILIIDDEEYIRVTLKTLLEHDGHEVSTADNGRAGLRLVEKEPFDLVISDIIMPEQDGFEVIKAVLMRENPPKIIAMSGGSKDLEQGYLLAMANLMHTSKVLSKPFSHETLREAIREVL
jgi:CheY-like chemotaxis protein